MNQYSDKDDTTLVQMTLLGNQSAFEELVARHQRAVKSAAYSVTGCTFSAEDAAQDAFVSAWMNLSALRDTEKFGVWVRSIAKNHARTLEAQYRSAIPSLSLNEFENWDIPDTADSDFFEYADLHENIEALSEKIREAIKLHYFSDLSVKEIAQKLSISEGTVKWRLFEGRKQLRKGYGIMEKTYNENESVAARVMRQVEALKLWKIKDDKSGFEAEYHAVLQLVNDLPDSKEKSHMLADTWMLGTWWIPGWANDEVYAKIKKAAEDGHNEAVMQNVAAHECGKYHGEEKRNFMLHTQIPYFKEKGFPGVLGYTWFWLGYEYRRIGQYEKAIGAFEEVLKILPPENEYYANAKSAIYCETRVLKAMRREGFRNKDVHVSGETYRFIDGKLYFWSQPGYGGSEEIAGASIFWNLAACNHLLYDPKMQVGDVIVSDSGKGQLEFISDTETCDTPAGKFEHCLVFEFRGDKHGLTYCKTFLCAGTGIVRQEAERYGMRRILELSGAHIAGGEGIIPFAPGNRWDYQAVGDEGTVLYDKDIFFEITAYKDNAATAAAVICCETLGYSDTFDGKMEEIRQNYCTDGCDPDGIQHLIDVRGPLRRARELAQTRRQRVQIQVAEDVMLRILGTDPEITPDCTQIGRWNFYSSGIFTKTNGKTEWMQKEHFEWKNTSNLGPEGQKMLYSFFDEIIDECGMGRWNDRWVPGFAARPHKTLKEFAVLEDEAVTTPAGTFENCRHIRFDLALNSYFGGKSECFYAEGIGIVKFIHRMRGNTAAIWQLTAYRGIGEGFYPIADGLYRKYEPDQIGDGYTAALEYIFDSDEKDTRVFRNAAGSQNRADFQTMCRTNYH